MLSTKMLYSTTYMPNWNLSSPSTYSDIRKKKTTKSVVMPVIPVLGKYKQKDLEFTVK